MTAGYGVEMVIGGISIQADTLGNPAPSTSGDRPFLHRTLIPRAPWMALVAVTAVGVMRAPLSQSVSLYARYATAALAHPGQAWPVEYPPASILAMAPAALGPIAFAVAMAAVLWATWAVLRKEDGRGGAPSLWALWIFLGGLDMALARYDPVPTLALLLSVISARRGRWAGAWGWATTAACLKWFGVIVFPIWLVAEARSAQRWRWDRAAVCVGIFVATYALPVIWDGPRVLSSWLYFIHRPLALGSFPATLTAAITGTGRFVWAFGGYNYIGPAAAQTAIHVTVLVAGASLGIGILWRVWRGTMGVTAAAALAITGTVLAAAVFSPQYLLWMLPLWALAVPQTIVSLALGSAAALTTVAYPVLYDQLGASQDVSLVRNLLLVSAIILCIIQKRSPSAAPISGG